MADTKLLRERFEAALREHEGHPLLGLLREQASVIARLDNDKRWYFDAMMAIERALDEWPKMPSKAGLWALSGRGKYPEDWERGAQIQRELSSERIPGKVEYELAAGFWDRITGGAWRSVPTDTPEEGGE